MCFLFLLGLFVIALGADQSSVSATDMNTAEAQELWIRGQLLERDGDFDESNKVYESIVELVPDWSHIYWRISRNYIRLVTKGRKEAKETQLSAFKLAERWASRGMELDPECAECVLYRFIALSRSVRLKGPLASARRARELSKLLALAFQLEPKHSDNPGNHEMANLHFAAGLFYRLVPKGALMELILGVQGDPQLAIEHLEKAIEITPGRIDYHVELGAQLLCHGLNTNELGYTSKGIEVLERTRSLPKYQPTDEIDRRHAEVLLLLPRKSCDYWREQWLEEGIGF